MWSLLVTSASLISTVNSKLVPDFFFSQELNWKTMCQQLGKCVQRDSVSMFLSADLTHRGILAFIWFLFSGFCSFKHGGTHTCQCVSHNLKGDVSGYRLNRMRACLSNGTQVKVSSVGSTEAHVPRAMVYNLSEIEFMWSAHF